ncbi:MAG TPA: TIM barrel protein [Candidatus Paceibacterota bacterium]|nr:TIM barrel protein [Verrucomicrobiota bacterium]HRZ45332.1 TIM barrel protein [Candidatus Paceibacterota bacterium]HRZ93021.1 TIM barrel protein [Candidatus Paceibacterota bacterium]
MNNQIHSQISRRSALQMMAGGAAALGAVGAGSGRAAAAADSPAPLKGNIRHSVSRWCYGKLSLDDLCRAAKRIGIESIELLGADEWPVVRKHGLTCAMCNGPDKINYGFNRIEHHETLLKNFGTAIPEIARNGFPNVICFSGNRRGLGDEQGIENCVAGLKRLMPIAEKHKVTVILELLNSKVNHADYQADHTAWGVEVCKRVGSERLKLLYDIYHMQIMEGDIIRTIQESHPYIGHYHTGGNPGRNEIDDTQEIYYPAVMRAIVATGYKGFVGQEFVPDRDPLTSLEAAIRICDV